MSTNNLEALKRKYQKEEHKSGLTDIDKFNFIYQQKPTPAALLDPKKLKGAYNLHPDTDGNSIRILGQPILYDPDANMFEAQEPPKNLSAMPEHQPPGRMLTPFQVLQIYRFGDLFEPALNHIRLHYTYSDFPFFRIGFKYYKQEHIRTPDGTKTAELIPCTYDDIKRIYGKDAATNKIHALDAGFTVRPSNLAYDRLVDGHRYNLYEPFEHEPNGTGALTDIPYTAMFLKHIFGEQLEYGFQYFKVLYEKPAQRLPILALVSEARETGKTTLLNYLASLFGANYGQMDSSDLASEFNAHYAYKNIIGIDETFVDKRSPMERIKYLSTAKAINYRRMYTDKTMIPFYGKFVMCSNNVTDFIRIDESEIRFWVRHIPPLTDRQKDQQLDQKMIAEIPAFLAYLEAMPDVHSNSRQVFNAAQLANDALRDVQANSRSGVHKELLELIDHFFGQNEGTNQFEASAVDIKNRWFDKTGRVEANYIRKVLKEEMKLPTEKGRYYPFGKWPEKISKHFIFTRSLIE